MMLLGLTLGARDVWVRLDWTMHLKICLLLIGSMEICLFLLLVFIHGRLVDMKCASKISARVIERDSPALKAHHTSEH